MALFEGNSLWGLVMQGDVMTKGVLLFLLGMSVACWAVALYKMILLRIKKAQLKKALQELRQATTFEDLFAVATVHNKTMPGYLLSRCLHEVKQLLQLQDSMGQTYAQGAGLTFLQQQFDQLVDELLYYEQTYLSVLTSSAAVAPLLGLFGTVWGLVHSFIRIAQKQSADIVTVAPGIAEALITTLAGLLVAVPAVMLLYTINASIKDVEQQLVELSEVTMRMTRLLVCKAKQSASVDPTLFTTSSDVTQDMS